jgi:hypothetical protein
VDPARQPRRLAFVADPQFAAGMGAIEVHEWSAVFLPLLFFGPCPGFARPRLLMWVKARKWPECQGGLVAGRENREQEIFAPPGKGCRRP